jgi:hypothetical protein
MLVWKEIKKILKKRIFAILHAIWPLGCSLVVVIFLTFLPWIWQMNFERINS